MILRKALLYLARQAWLRRWMESSSLTHRVVRRFVAGETLASAIDAAARLRNEGISATLDHLGENVTSLDEARQSVEAARQALIAIQLGHLDATISIKLTQFGLAINEDACLASAIEVAEAALRAGTRVEIDMEASDYTESTLRIVRRLQARCGNVRAVLQAYLYRTAADAEELSNEGIPVRLCKGAYLEPPEVAFPEKHDVDRNYSARARVLLARGIYPAFATHDEKIVNDLLTFLRACNTQPGQFEFQMLYGVRRNLQRRLVKAGYRVRVYVPYGAAWFPYFMRRLAERPANVLFLVRTFFKH